MKAKSVIENKQGIISIVDPIEVQAAKNDDLTVGDKKLLLVRGHDTRQVVAAVYLEFNRRRDSTGSPFKFSRKMRGLVEVDPIWQQLVKVSPNRISDYVKSWFELGELLQTAVGEVIILVSELPRMSVNLWTQTRFLGQHAELFDWID